MNDYVQRHLEEIEAAAERIGPYVRRTPALATDLDPKLVLKPECLQVTGSFKARGAFNALIQLRQRKPDLHGVIAVSSGNHAQGVALAARTLGLPAVVVMPADSNPSKVAATRALGAEVISEGVTAENREATVRRLSDERGLELIHPFDDWDVIHGQGTAALELLQDRPDVRTIVAPVGGGGLISGTALAAKGREPNIRIIGVEPELAADAAASLRQHARQSLSGPPATIADGVRTMAIGQRSFEVIVERGLVADIVTVSEQEIEAAVVLAWERLKLALEPTGALPLAASLKMGELTGATALMLSGGNFDRRLVSRLFMSS
ncbi:MAG TPA: threonine/serine dehydratase [Chloroflexota bacterium]|nr:threonine/serine dehydratase [Chloroflexota bacterium]